MPFGAAFAPIQMYPPPTPIPLVFFDSVLTVFSSVPFQSTRHALSDFCSAIHKPSGDTAIALGYPSGLLKSGVVFALRTRGCDAPPLAVCAPARRVPIRPTARLPRNSRLLVFMCASIGMGRSEDRPL